MSATVPMEETLPWSTKFPRNVLVSDSIETDGAFLLHTFAKKALTDGLPVWWVTARPMTDRQIATALKKIGSDIAATYLRRKDPSAAATAFDLPLQISSISTEIASIVAKGEDPSMEFDGKAILKGLYKKIRDWVSNMNNQDNDSCCCWLVLDDMSALATMMGDEVLTYQFVDSLYALSQRTQKMGILTRVSAEVDQIHLKAAQLNDVSDKTGWLGAGGKAQQEATKREYQQWIPWERTLDASDIMVDVIPLSSGYSREAHGRLVFSESPGGRGWSANKAKKGVGIASTPVASPWKTLVVNYCLQDSGVRAIRLRQTVKGS